MSSCSLFTPRSCVWWLKYNSRKKMKVGIVPFLTFKKLGKRKIMILFFAKYFMAYLYIFVLIVITVTFQILELFKYIVKSICLKMWKKQVWKLFMFSHSDYKNSFSSDDSLMSIVYERIEVLGNLWNYLTYCNINIGYVCKLNTTVPNLAKISIHTKIQ